MCPVILLTFIYSLLCLFIQIVTSLSVNYGINEVRIKEGESTLINFTLTDKIHSTYADGHLYYQLRISSPRVADLKTDGSMKRITLDKAYLIPDKNGYFNYSSSVTIVGKLLGHTNLFLQYINPNDTHYTNGLTSALKDNPPCAQKDDEHISSSAESLTVNLNSLVNGENVVDKTNQLSILVSLKHSKLENVFTLSVVSLVLLNFINMGCAVDLVVIQSVLKKPIAPLIGLISQYVVMPLTAWIVGYFLLSGEAYYYWFGLFAFGCSPGGNASNMWTLLLGGNLNLSLTMTFISTFAALFMIPLWLFTLGIYVNGPSTINVPYIKIVRTLAAMAFFLGIGLLFQKYLPKVSKICKRILAPVSTAMIIFIVIFSTYVYWSMVKLLTWRILISAGLNVWVGFLIGFVFAVIFSFEKADQIAIAIETGVQNTGISIMLIRLALKPPESDLATLLPVAASLMTPIPLMFLWIIKRCCNCKGSKNVIYSPPEDEIIHKHLRTPQSVNGFNAVKSF
ncbi:hepatic sodium/bile acid cotransporter-like [Panonychus citri]|uniref:hepatic sodium/bile acid cotransporter-like n=1 Tax=Panonychus citri TaxID=50023 RepID=UPI002307B833|nr:hepatic sodium/bile acid cotransporter-like [Panonychus citri]